MRAILDSKAKEKRSNQRFERLTGICPMEGINLYKVRNTAMTFPLISMLSVPTMGG